MNKDVSIILIPSNFNQHILIYVASENPLLIHENFP